MLLQEPVQAAVWDALNHYAYSDATFLAERLYAEVASDESQYLLATCYYRAGKPHQTYSLLEKRGCHSAECKFLFARSCYDVGKYAEAELILAGNILSAQKLSADIEAEFGSLASHVFSLLGAIFSRTERQEKAISCYRTSLKLNPLLWSSYERLCQLGEKVDPMSVFHTPAHVLPNVIPKIVKEAPPPVCTPPIMVTDASSPVSEVTANTSLPIQSISPAPPQSLSLPQTQQTSLSPLVNMDQRLFSQQHTPENTIGNIHDQVVDSILRAPPRTGMKPRCKPTTEQEGSITSDAPIQLLFKFLSPTTPSFGILPLVTPSPDHSRACPVYTPSPMALQEATNETKAPRKPVTRRTNQIQTLMPKPPTFNLTGNSRDINTNINKQTINQPTVRRSSRLFGHSNSSSVKENNKQQSKGRLTSPKAVGRKSKTRINKSKQDLNDLNKGEIIFDSKPDPEPTPEVQLAQMQQQSYVGILTLLQAIGKAYQALAQYSCQEAVDLFMELPPHQVKTGWVLCQIGRAYFELQEYHEAERHFSEVMRNEPYFIKGMEIYSTTLWHLQKEVELSALAQDLTEMDKHSPEAWCATGNCFSLQREHDTAIKIFQRAIQISPSFAYAYTLLGHEYVYTEELDKAMACFRNAIRMDARHYNAWYGVGLIYYKQDKYSLAEVHFRKALMINPQSSALLCHIGVVQHAQQKSIHALGTLNKAIATDPKNPLCKFHRASILFSSDKHKEALEELEELKQIIPKESLIYFLIGKVHKKMGNTHLALMNFSWAMDLDPKGLNNQIKEAIDKRYVTEDDDSLVQLNDTGVTEGTGASGSNSSLDPDEILQAVESDESL